MSIRILYDGGGFVERYGGVSKYYAEIMKNLPEGFEWKLGMRNSANLNLLNEPFKLRDFTPYIEAFKNKYCFGFCPKHVHKIYALFSLFFPKYFCCSQLENYRALKDALKKGDFDVYHMTGAHYYSRQWKRVVGYKPIVITVHDLIPELIFKDKRVANNRRTVLSIASRIIAVSQNTKEDLRRLYNVPGEKISVIYHGHEPVTNNRQDDDRCYQKEFGKYILYVGKRGGYKNFLWFIRAVAPILRERNICLVCTGERFSAAEINLIRDLDIRRLVKQRFFNDIEMRGLYSNAVAFVYPSEYEGFGIPILDSFSAGCPVVLSRSSCFPEVARDAALYYERRDATALCGHIEHLIDNREFRAKMIARGYSRIRDFSWTRCASETADVYRKVVEEFLPKNKM